ncbi:peroxisomal biogenesis factor 11 [Coemansia reversa NRRL 1564]|uniref:Peroxisomal biogenesis factor 11 n=1 Tax=Coemansia reversa (strain ATCC 12441 / NRRL 1564) TaxID=763665 RepID=A0A2G5BHJ2_COERN|nr:peroxisomal biogenesis factor 11 [Coemansia reversa NRRL 1564]|eukprot:PIA18488.1 peroxisomal biogenesis factor 11 [Coemansia reversa NRRL 1564]
MDCAKYVVLAAANSRVVDVYVRYINMLVGRDKACRLGQYVARLLIYLVNRRVSQLGKTSSRLEWIMTLTRIQQTLSTTRKVMRSGKFLAFFQQAVRTLTSVGDDEVVRTLGAAHKLGMCVFMVADTIGLLGTTLALVRLRNPARVARLGQRAWMYALIAQLLSTLYQLRGLSIRSADLQRVRRHVGKAGDVMAERECAMEEQAIRTQRKGLTRQLTTSALDLAIPIKGLGILPLNEGLVGMAGSITSLMGVQDVLGKASG